MVDTSEQVRRPVFVECLPLCVVQQLVSTPLDLGLNVGDWGIVRNGQRRDVLADPPSPLPSQSAHIVDVVEHR